MTITDKRGYRGRIVNVLQHAVSKLLFGCKVDQLEVRFTLRPRLPLDTRESRVKFKRDKRINDFPRVPSVSIDLSTPARFFETHSVQALCASLVKLFPSSFQLILLRRIRDRAYRSWTIIRRRKSYMHNRERQKHGVGGGKCGKFARFDKSRV